MPLDLRAMLPWMKRLLLLAPLLPLGWQLGGCVRQEPRLPAAMPAAMPGKSFGGSLPPLTDAERQLGDRLKAHVRMIGGTIGERNVWKYDKLEAAAAYIEGELKKLGYDPGRQPYEAGGKTVRNIDATLPGSGSGAPANEIVVVGAHYDSVRGAPGANDNGTGVAATLELARLLKDGKPARTIRFALFVNEEPPFFHTELMGSVVYAKRSRKRGEKVVGMLSLETIGFYSDEKGSQQYPPPFNRYFPDTGNFIAFVGDDSAAEFVARCVGSFRRHTKFPSEGGALPDTIEGIGWSDHWAFTREGYPALMVTDTAPFRYRHYHTAEDTPEKVDYDRTARVTAGVARVVEELAGAARRSTP
jgi:Zn-dependent M28 family amino/carboxypeptidase